MDFRDVLHGIDHKNIEKGVDPYLEAASICRKEPKRAWIAPANGKDGWRLAGNVFSRRETIASALGTSMDGMVDSMMSGSSDPAKVKKTELPGHYLEMKVPDLPIPTYFKGDGGPYITSGIFHAGIDGKFNVSFHRMMHIGGNRFAVRVVPRHLKTLLKMARDQGKDLEAVVSIGVDPYSLLAASTSVGFGQDEMEVASSLRIGACGEPLEVFEPAGDGLYAPAGTEVVMMGSFLDEQVPEGPFVDITSTYDHAGMEPGEPVFEVKKVLARKDPIMHVLLPGGNEHYQLMGLPKEPAIKRSVGMVVPKVNGVRLTEGGCCWLHGIISITQQKQGDSRNAIMAAFSGHPSMKRVIVVDKDIDIIDDAQVEWALATRFQAGKDLVIVKKARGSTLDPSADSSDLTTSKMGLDATMPMGNEDRFKKVD